MQDYPGTSDARRALLDISLVYARRGDWTTAEAPYRYVMDVAKGQPEARIARTRLLILYQYAETLPEGLDPIVESRATIAADTGTPEEGLERLVLTDLLFRKQHAPGDAFPEFERLLTQFPNQSYTNYVRIHYALGLAGAEQAEQRRRLSRSSNRCSPTPCGRAGLPGPWEGPLRIEDDRGGAGGFPEGLPDGGQRLHPGDALAEMATIYENLNQPDQARECLRPASRCSPGGATA